MTFVGVLVPTPFSPLQLVGDVLPKRLSVHALLPREMHLLLVAVLRMEIHRTALLQPRHRPRIISASPLLLVLVA